ncbi:MULTISPECIES: ABC transporter permease [unclassified Oceanispirochaeta]|uniref:ABC transporter permease n=1 Tax=unclassified Oceanispirochaeta TaxID=2635722 RepID=UPI000E09382B|nr:MULTISPECIES: ABC transporter permease [unclassified Oceanispirochaeta]MBF9014570.1 ABC transporter permease [Oceanispirochaeta sp. M2]NPD70826.1 ABC transporter permease [Oceanispirochaeta sp. M1]RDG34108.1 ABC transporter permease [Oceanispirochaeta sp. M1]
MNKIKENFSIIAFSLLTLLVLIIFGTFSEQFFTVGNFLKAFKHLSITAISALGLTFVVSIGHNDMSFHYFSCFSAMTMSWLIGLGFPPLAAILIGLLPAVLFGFINGVAIGTLELPDMIVTIGLGSAVYGLAYIYSGGSYIYRNFQKSGIMELNNATVAGLPLPVIFLIILYFSAWLLLHRSVHGRRFYAIGSNKTAALFSAIPVKKYIIAAFVICAVLSSFTNMVQIAAQGKGYLKGGLMLLMPSWAAVFVGISIFKKPTVYGTFLGAFLISIMQNGFTLMAVPFYFMDLVIGIVLIFSIIISGLEFTGKKKSQVLKKGEINAAS